MKLMARLVSGFVLTLLVAPVLLLYGCGAESGAPEMLTLYEKCENWANDTDVFEVAPESGTLTISGTFLGGSIQYAPLFYVLSDAQGNPRNGVCVSFSTDGTFYLDESRTLPITPSISGVTNITLRTDYSGAIYVYWATEDLPSAGGTDDETGQTWVSARSGSRTHDFTIDWTISAPEATP
jgi:hypothetical protein